jgi:TusA-related sulfurtransferase
MNIIDVKGKTSFKAVSEVHSAIETLEPGEFGVVSNDELVLRNIEKILRKKNIEFTTEKRQAGEFFTTFLTTKEHSKPLTPGVEKQKENTNNNSQPTANWENQKTILVLNSSVSSGTNLTLKKLHIRNILNELAISGKLVNNIIFSGESVKLLDNNNELFPILTRVIRHKIKIIADEPSLAFFAVKPAKELKVETKTTGAIFKIISDKQTKIITI